MTLTVDRGGLEMAALMYEVRTKLYRIAADAGGLVASAADPGGVDAGLLDRVDHSVMFLEHAIEHLLHLDRLDVAALRVIDLCEVVASAVDASKELERIDYVRQAPVMVRADAGQVAFAVSSLIGAALEASRRSTVLVRVSREGSAAQVAIVAAARPSESALAVRVALRTAELHGGTATVREMVGLTRWTFEVPAVMAGVRVLLVDDNIEQVAALAEILRRPGLLVDFATSGGQALARIAVHAPDVLVVDAQIPDMDGVEVIRQARERLPDLPVGVLTGYPPDHPAIVHATTGGRGTYLAKPVDVEALIAFVASAVTTERLP